MRAQHERVPGRVARLRMHVGQLNPGQLVRQRIGMPRLIRLTTHTGSVAATSNWGEPAEDTRAPLAAGQRRAPVHDLGMPQILLPLDQPELRDLSVTPRLERAIGVIYRPDSERASHSSRRPGRNSSMRVLHIDKTHALEPLERRSTTRSITQSVAIPIGDGQHRSRRRCA